MTRKLFALMILFIFCLNISGKEKREKEQLYEIEIVEVGKLGTCIVKVWSYNKKPMVDDETVLRNAIHGILFKGVEDAGRTKGRKALVSDGYESNKEYFDQFFASKAYVNFARIGNNSHVDQGDLIKMKKLYKIGKLVVISYDTLRSKLEKDKVIKGLTQGF